jgi:4-amino-4-deoxy-L-arabinose transferase-like glycosyltransferase
LTVSESESPSKKSWLALAGLFALLLVLAAVRPLAVPDEGRYGGIGLWMLQSGDWLTPRLNGIAFFHKPPYLYWLEAMSLATFGVHPWALRLVPALHAGLMLLALYLSARRLATEVIARRAVLMLGSSLAFLVGGQYVNHDMLVAAWIGVAIWCFAFAFMDSDADRPHAGLARLGFLACAFGVLSKGLIGFALPGLVLLIWLLWTRQLRKILYLPWISGLLLFTLIAVPWFVLASQRFPGMLAYLFGTQHFARYTASTFNNPRPWWFYLVCLVALLFPWVFFAIYQGIQQALARIVKTPRAPQPGGPWVSLCWIWLVAIIGFFSIPVSKIIGYALPVMPALALLAALGWERSLGQRQFAGKLFAVLCLLSLGLAVTLNIAATRFTDKLGSHDVAAVLACQARPADEVYVVEDFPHDLLFYTQSPKPLIVVQDWTELRQSAGDNWRREMFEGADFDQNAALVLQTPQVLAAAAARPGNWLLEPRETPARQARPGWNKVAEGGAWRLYESAGGSAAEGPEPAQHKGLPGCQDQGKQQRQQ